MLFSVKYNEKIHIKIGKILFTKNLNVERIWLVGWLLSKRSALDDVICSLALQYFAARLGNWKNGGH